MNKILEKVLENLEKSEKTHHVFRKGDKVLNVTMSSEGDMEYLRLKSPNFHVSLDYEKDGKICTELVRDVYGTSYVSMEGGAVSEEEVKLTEIPFVNFIQDYEPTEEIDLAKEKLPELKENYEHAKAKYEEMLVFIEKGPVTDKGILEVEL